MIVKRYALAAVTGLLLSGAAQAAVIDLGDSHAASMRMADGSTARRNEMAAAQSMSELPEPEVFAMMLVGLVLIGYRASRDSNEKFE